MSPFRFGVPILGLNRIKGAEVSDTLLTSAQYMNQ